jgi:hypothetical protein
MCYILREDFLNSVAKLKLYALKLRTQAKEIFSKTLFGVTIRDDRDLN